MILKTEHIVLEIIQECKAAPMLLINHFCLLKDGGGDHIII